MSTNTDFKRRLYKKINSYRDKYFKFLLTMVRNVFAFRQIPTETLRNVVYVLKEKSAHKGIIILRAGEYSSQTYFVKRGRVFVYMKDEEWHKPKPFFGRVSISSGINSETKKEWNLFATLNKGSSFNIVNSFLGRPSLFYFVAAEANT